MNMEYLAIDDQLNRRGQKPTCDAFEISAFRHPAAALRLSQRIPADRVDRRRPPRAMAIRRGLRLPSACGAPRTEWIEPGAGWSGRTCSWLSEFRRLRTRYDKRGQPPRGVRLPRSRSFAGNRCERRGSRAESVPALICVGLSRHLPRAIASAPPLDALVGARRRIAKHCVVTRTEPGRTSSGTRRCR